MNLYDWLFIALLLVMLLGTIALVWALLSLVLFNQQQVRLNHRLNNLEVHNVVTRQARAAASRDAQDR